VVLAAVLKKKMQTAPPLRRRTDGVPQTPHAERGADHEAVRSWVMLGGRTHIPPANRVEYEMRCTPASMWFR